MNKRIIIFTDSYPYGGGEPFFEPELHHLAGCFEHVSLLPVEMRGSSVTAGKLPPNTEVIEPPFFRLKSKLSLLAAGIFNFSPLRIFIKEGFSSGVFLSPSKFRTWFSHLLMIRYLISFIRKMELLSFFSSADLLYFYWGLRWSQILPFLPAGRLPKTVVRFHGSDLYEHTNNGYIPWRQKQLSGIDFLVTVSETGKRYLKEQYSVAEEKIFLSRLGTSDYGINPFREGDPVRIVSCSNLVPVKRVELLAEALKYLKFRAEWIHFGDGPCRGTVEEAASSLPSGISFRLAGHINHDDLVDFYSRTSVTIFINVSSSEGVPVSVMEALSFGIPVIATDAGGTAEIVNNSNGRIIPVDFLPADLAGIIENFITSSRYIEYRLNARKSWEDNCQAEKLLPLFSDFLLSV